MSEAFVLHYSTHAQPASALDALSNDFACLRADLVMA